METWSNSPSMGLLMRLYRGRVVLFRGRRVCCLPLREAARVVIHAAAQLASSFTPHSLMPSDPRLGPHIICEILVPVRKIAPLECPTTSYCLHHSNERYQPSDQMEGSSFIQGGSQGGPRRRSPSKPGDSPRRRHVIGRNTRARHAAVACLCLLRGQPKRGAATAVRPPARPPALPQPATLRGRLVVPAASACVLSCVARVCVASGR